MGIICELVDPIMDCTTCVVGLVQSVEDLTRRKSPASSEQERLLQQTAFRLHLQNQLFLVLRQTVFRL